MWLFRGARNGNDLVRFDLVRFDQVRPLSSWHVGIDFLIICGPMYPCSDAELVAAVSEAEAIGIIQANRRK